MTSTPLLVERDGAVLTLRLDRPQVLNALDAALVEALLDAVAAIHAAPDVRCLVLAGNGRAFSAGADLTGMLAMTVPEFTAFIDDLQELARRMRGLRIPRSPRSRGTRWRAGSSSPWPATSEWQPRTRSSACPTPGSA